MRIIGFNFNKISIDKLNEADRNTKISTNIDISDIKEIKTDLFKTKEEMLGVKFSYKVKYEPNVAEVELNGNMIISLDSKLKKEILKKWKDKKMPDDFRISLFNVILVKSSAKILSLEDEMNLPLHLPLPTFKRDQNSK